MTKREELMCWLGERFLWEAGGYACESPIEEMLLAALLFPFDAEAASYGPTFRTAGPWGEHVYESLEAGGFEPRVMLGCASINGDGAIRSWALFAQERVGRYRVDFALVEVGASGRVAVECDGHDFHERTKEQAARDKRRDRDLQALGWRVLRFTGSEIHADAHHCAEEVLTVLRAVQAKEPKP